MNMRYLLGLDVGTSAVKAVLLETGGRLVGSVLEEYPLSTPRPGWSEQNPEDMWQATIKAAASIVSKFNVAPSAIVGIGLSGQMHSSIFLDQNKQVIRPAILWNDVRTSAQCRRIENTMDRDLLRSEICNPVLEGFTLPKVLWLKENEPENYGRLRHLVLPKDYIRFRLTFPSSARQSYPCS
jgi:xylulokinase